MRSLLEAVALGWVVGHVAGAVIAQSAARRGMRIDEVRMRERVALLGAAAGAGFDVLSKLY